MPVSRLFSAAGEYTIPERGDGDERSFQNLRAILLRDGQKRHDGGNALFGRDLPAALRTPCDLRADRRLPEHGLAAVFGTGAQPAIIRFPAAKNRRAGLFPAAKNRRMAEFFRGHARTGGRGFFRYRAKKIRRWAFRRIFYVCCFNRCRTYLPRRWSGRGLPFCANGRFCPAKGSKTRPHGRSSGRCPRAG